MLRSASVIALLALTACSTPPAAPSPINRQLTLAPGESSQVADGLSLRFVGVPAESRCPGDAFCVTAGDATVRIEVNAVEGELHTATPQAVQLAGVTISLVSLDPYPFNTRPIQQGDYRATVRVRR